MSYQDYRRAKRSGGDSYQNPAYDDYRDRQWKPRSYGKQKEFRVNSGCKRVQKDNKVYMSAWKKTRGSFLSILVAESRKSEKVEGKNGKMYITSVSVIITNKDTGAKNFHWGICDASMTHCKVNGLGWVISTKKGGFVKTRNLS